MLADQIDVLLISPERFANNLFLDRLFPIIAEQISLLVVDEAHCISDWGHDFRPDYRRLSNIVRQLPGNSSLLATTATANHRVILDITSQLSDIRVLRGPLLRENLALQSLGRMSIADRLAWLASALPTIEGQGIIYTLTTSDADTVTLWLNFRGISAASYHSQLTLELRSVLEDRFEAGNVRILVATSALGLGYDNPNVRFVIHYQSPGSMIAYYQQVGRAGRNHTSALGILMNGDEDERINKFFRMNSLPFENEISQILNRLDELDQTSLLQLSSKLNISPKRIESTLKFLAVQTPATVAEAGGIWQRNPVPFPEGYADTRSELIGLREKESREVQDYRRSHTGCQMRMIQNALDDPIGLQDCGRCDHCIGHPIVSMTVEPGLMRAAGMFLKSPSGIRLAPKLRVPAGCLARYATHGSLSRHELTVEGRALLKWGDIGLGNEVARGKHRLAFDDILIDAAVAMIRNVWKPLPFPEWITAVPSLRNADLVANLAKSIAGELELAYAPVVVKVRETSQQKLQQNEFHQCHNLDGAFVIEGRVPKGPVLLIDDVVDSGWTFAVIGLLLRRAGSGPVFPFALASSRTRDS